MSPMLMAHLAFNGRSNLGRMAVLSPRIKGIIFAIFFVLGVHPSFGQGNPETSQQRAGREGTMIMTRGSDAFCQNSSVRSPQETFQRCIAQEMRAILLFNSLLNNAQPNSSTYNRAALCSMAYFGVLGLTEMASSRRLLMCLDGDDAAYVDGRPLSGPFR